MRLLVAALVTRSSLQAHSMSVKYELLFTLRANADEKERVCKVDLDIGGLLLARRRGNEISPGRILINSKLARFVPPRWLWNACQCGDLQLHAL